MAKVSLSKLVTAKKVEPKVVVINEQEVTVQQYLPIEEKMLIVQNVINSSLDVNNFLSPGRIDVFLALEIVRAYTNISLTEKMITEAPKTYDLLKTNGILDAVIAAIPNQEYQTLYSYVLTVIESTNEYFHSFLGVLKSISNDYDNTSMDLEKLFSSIKDPTALSTLKDIMDKIG